MAQTLYKSSPGGAGGLRLPEYVPPARRAGCNPRLTVCNKRKARRKAGPSQCIKENAPNHTRARDAHKFRDFRSDDRRPDGLSIPEIARRIRVSRCHGYRLAAGEVRRPSYETFQCFECLHAHFISKGARAGLGAYYRYFDAGEVGA
jgi:hypothetical protein